MAEKKRPPEMKARRTFLKVGIAGQANVGKDRLDRLFDHVRNMVAEEPEAPCEGGVLLVRWAGWRCEFGVWVFVEVNTWRCPDGSIVDVEEWIEITDDPCEEVPVASREKQK